MNPLSIPLGVDLDALPTVAHVRLPDAYESAKAALAECERIDECQHWANKAEALASYAKQARDDSLRILADRIQARAIRRCGVLLRAIEPGKTGPKLRDGTDPQLTRTQAAEDAGLSERQRKTALRVANVPEESFEQQVESDDPPTVTVLAEQGKTTAPQTKLKREHVPAVYDSPASDVQVAYDDEDEGEDQEELCTNPILSLYAKGFAIKVESEPFECGGELGEDRHGVLASADDRFGRLLILFDPTLGGGSFHCSFQETFFALRPGDLLNVEGDCVFS